MSGKTNVRERITELVECATSDCCVTGGVAWPDAVDELAQIAREQEARAEAAERDLLLYRENWMAIFGSTPPGAAAKKISALMGELNFTQTRAEQAEQSLAAMKRERDEARRLHDACLNHTEVPPWYGVDKAAKSEEPTNG